MIHRIARLLLLGTLFASLPVAAAPSLDDFLRRDIFSQMKLSPDGEYLAATVPLDGRNALVVLRRADLQKTADVAMLPNNYVSDFWFANNQRVLFSVAQKFGQLEQPQSTGEIFALNADGSQKATVIAGFRADDVKATRIKRSSQLVGVQLLDLLKNNDDEVLITTSAFTSTGYPEVERMNVNDGRRVRVAKSPITYGGFAVDPLGQVRFAFGMNADNRQKTYYRDARGDKWRLVNDEDATDQTATPVGFDAAGTTAYLRVSHASGPDGLYAYDTATGKKTLVLMDETVDPYSVLRSPVDGSVYGVMFLGPMPRIAYLDAEHPLARLHASMAANFPDQFVMPSSYTDDGRVALFVVGSDRNPGDFYLLDAESKQATYIASRANWLNTDELATTRAISLNARDGLTLHGFLTVPNGSNGRNMPLIVLPHGGPFGPFDFWLFEPERQIIASRGYAVLQVNFRGSGNYGRSFEKAGHRQWGGPMQDDLTDATRWAIEQGIADPQRICLYGSSYGGYASLMGAAKEPALYRCIAGNVGVYDMEVMYHAGDIARSVFGQNFLKEALGKTDLAAVSPNRLADRITAPVFLAAGGKDDRAPPKHTELMRDALKRAGRQVESKIYKNEGHGYFAPEARKDYYTRLLAFFDRHLGTTQPATASP
jgi:dienelactone hydrolase